MSITNQAAQQITASPSSTLQNEFFNSPAFQLQYGTGPQQQVAQTGSYNPATAFANDPGVTLATQQGAIPLENNFAARGLSQSGALSQALTQYMYNNYNQYTAGQGSLFNTYQNQLSGLASLGANTATNQANTINSDASTIATGTSANNMNTASGVASANLGTANNISTLLGNQGVLDASAYLNTGAAQAGNLFQGASMGQQIASNQQANQAQTQSSLFQGQGAMAGAQAFQGVQAGASQGNAPSV